jgi:hypothetical protein
MFRNAGFEKTLQMMNSVMFIVTHHRPEHLDIPVHTVYTVNYYEMWQYIL